MELEKMFSASEIETIKRFVIFCAESNRQAADLAGFDDDSGNDETVRQEVREWLAKRYALGHGKRRKG
jgi:hypothetical protein